MRFFSQAGIAAALAAAVTAGVIVTDTDIVYATELVYVDTAGHILTEVPYSPSSTRTIPSTSSCSSSAYIPPPPPPKPTTQSPSPQPTTQSPPPKPTTQSPPPAPTTTSIQQAPTTFSTRTTSSSPAPTQPPSGGCAQPSSIYDAANALCAGASDQAYCRGAIGAHNLHRSNHSVAAVVWNTTLEQWAQQHVETCVFQDYLLDDGSYHQSNAWAGTGSAGDAEVATHSWYNGEMPLFAGLYGNPNPPAKVNDNEIGHFANVIWKGWSSIGCATKLCDQTAGMTNAHLTLCFYSVYDLAHQEYNVNVLPPNGCPTYPANGY